MFGHRNASGRGNFENLLAESFRTSGPPQSYPASSEMVDELWVDTKVHPSASEEHPVIQWPAQSPDPNPIEHLSAHPKRITVSHPEAPAGILGLSERVSKE